MKSRIHLYPHRGPNSRGYIVAERSALRSLARHLEDVATGVVGFDKVRCYSSDGHEYELVLVCDVSEEEWQNLPIPSDTNSDPEKLSIIKTYNELSAPGDS